MTQAAQSNLEALVTTAPSPAFYAALVLYLLSSALYMGVFLRLPAWSVRLARTILLLAFIAHGIDIGWRGVEGVHPGTSVREAMGFLAWVLVGGFLLAGRKAQLKFIGVYLAPAVMVVLAVARLSPSGEAVQGLSSLGRIHIALATIGVAVFALATAVAGLYLAQERNLKGKHFDGPVFKEGAALEPLDRLLHRLVLIGFPIFTVSLVLGAIWAAERPETLRRPEVPIAVVTWLSFAVLLIGRTLRGWRGRRAAVLTLVGFASAVIVLGIYFLRRAMGA